MEVRRRAGPGRVSPHPPGAGSSTASGTRLRRAGRGATREEFLAARDADALDPGLVVWIDESYDDVLAEHPSRAASSVSARPSGRSTRTEA